jgi:hypothetical protein
MNTQKYIFLIVVLAIVCSFAVTAPLLASANQQGLGINLDVNLGQGKTNPDGKNNQGMMDLDIMMPALVGKVSAINGNMLTVVSNTDSNGNTTTATFTVDTTNAKLLRGNAAITLSNIAVGDNVVVQGTTTGTNVVATIIRDGKVGNGNEKDNNQALLQIQGNGQPVVAGTVLAINGLAITVTNSSKVTYTVDATNAKIIQGANTIFLASVKIGDSVIVQGVVNGTAVAASTIIDTNATAGIKAHVGFFGSIGQWFTHFFGF